MKAFWDRKEKPFMLLVFTLPFVWMVFSLLSGRYFPDPGKLLMNISGIWASIFIVMVLMLTPLAKIKLLRFVSRYRRFIGITAFLYASLHLLIYLVLFAGLSWSWISSDLVEKPYIYAGVVALLILSVLSVTSTKKMMRRLGRNWKPVHRFVYVAALAVIAHLWWQVKSDISIALWFTVPLVLLLMLRLNKPPLLKNLL